MLLDSLAGVETVMHNDPPEEMPITVPNGLGIGSTAAVVGLVVEHEIVGGYDVLIHQAPRFGRCHQK